MTGTGMTGGGNIVFLNKTVTNSTRFGMANAGRNTVVARCIFWNNGTDTQGVDREDNIFADAMLTDGFRPRLGNPAIDAGVAS